MSFLDEGRGSPIIMLHGNPTWSFYYRNLVLLLRDRYRIVVPDHLGSGLSDKPQNYPYRLANHIDNLEKLLRHLAIEHFSLVMHDWGGAIGMGLASRLAGRVDSLVVMNTAAFRSRRIPLRIRVCRIPLLGDIIVRGFNGFSRAALHMAVSKPLAPEIARGYLAPYDTWQNRIGVLRFVQDIPLSRHDASWETLVAIENSLEQFRRTPMLLLWGGKDFCFTEHFFNEWQQRFPQAESTYFERAGHYVLEEEFAAIGPLVVSFFSRHLK